MNPEIEAKEQQEFSNTEIGAVEVPVDMTERIAEQTKEDLYELPNELRTAFDRVAPGLGAEVYSRAQELSGDLLRQLEDSQARGASNEYGSFHDNTTVSAEREAMGFGEINRMVTALKLLAEQLDDQTRSQTGDTRIIDLDKLDAGEERAVPEFWYLLTGEREYGSGHEIQAGEYTLNAQQSQDAQGPGSETRKLVIRKTAKLEKAESDAAEMNQEDVIIEENSTVVDLEDRRRNMPPTRYGREASERDAA
jgi:hypothetical protein